MELIRYNKINKDINKIPQKSTHRSLGTGVEAVWFGIFCGQVVSRTTSLLDSVGSLLGPLEIATLSVVLDGRNVTQKLLQSNQLFVLLFHFKLFFTSNVNGDGLVLVRLAGTEVWTRLVLLLLFKVK